MIILTRTCPVQDGQLLDFDCSECGTVSTSFLRTGEPMRPSVSCPFCFAVEVLQNASDFPPNRTRNGLIVSTRLASEAR